MAISRRGALPRRSIIIAASERSEPATSLPHAAGSSASLDSRGILRQNGIAQRDKRSVHDPANCPHFSQTSANPTKLKDLPPRQERDLGLILGLSRVNQSLDVPKI